MVLIVFTVWCMFCCMEKLKQFLKSIPVSERDAFAKRCRTTWAFLRNVMYGQRIPNEKLCVALERESGYIVTRQDLRVDWSEIWPELMLESGCPGETRKEQLP